MVDEKKEEKQQPEAQKEVKEAKGAESGAKPETPKKEEAKKEETKKEEKREVPPKEQKGEKAEKETPKAEVSKKGPPKQAKDEKEEEAPKPKADKSDRIKLNQMTLEQVEEAIAKAEKQMGPGFHSHYAQSLRAQREVLKSKQTSRPMPEMKKAA